MRLAGSWVSLWAPTAMPPAIESKNFGVFRCKSNMITSYLWFWRDKSKISQNYLPVFLFAGSYEGKYLLENIRGIKCIFWEKKVLGTKTKNMIELFRVQLTLFPIAKCWIMKRGTQAKLEEETEVPVEADLVATSAGPIWLLAEHQQ